MKNKPTEAKSKFQSPLRVARHLFSRIVCLGAVTLICSTAPAQKLFMSDGYSGFARNLGNVYKIGPDGTPTSFASGLNGPLGLAFDSKGNLFVASFDGTILKFAPGGTRSTFAMGLNEPESLAFDGAGNLFATDDGNVFEFTPEGARTTFASGLASSSGLAFDSKGNLFVADQLGGNVYEFTPGGVRSTFASGLSSPFDLAFDSAGNLFVTDWGNGSGGLIYKFTSDGLRSTFAELGAPEGLVFDDADNLFVVDEDSGNIFMFTPNGVRSTFAEAVGSLGGMDEVAFLAFQPTQTDPTPTPTPTLTVKHAVPAVSLKAHPTSINGFNKGEGGAATFVASASSIVAETMVVNFSMGGSAVNGTDYFLSPNQITIPAGARSGSVLLGTFGFQAKGHKTVIMTLQPGTGYTRATKRRAKVVIHLNK